MKKSIITALLITLLVSCGFKLTHEWKIREWEIDGYSVVFLEKLGWAGPPYYEYGVYKEGRYLSYAGLVSNDSCLLRFEENRQRYIDFNLCTGTKNVHTDNKVLITAPDVDSVIIKGNGATLRLTKPETRKYVKMWNKAKPNGLNRLGKGYDYEVGIYTKGGVRRLKVLNSYVTENGSWSYEFKWNTFFEKMQGRVR